MSFGNSRNAFAPKKYYESSGAAKKDTNVSVSPSEFPLVDQRGMLTRSVSSSPGSKIHIITVDPLEFDAVIDSDSRIFTKLSAQTFTVDAVIGNQGNIHSLVVPVSISIDAAFEENPIQRVLYYTTQPYAVGTDDTFASSVSFSEMVLRYNPNWTDTITTAASVSAISVVQTYFPHPYSYIDENAGYDALTGSASVTSIQVGTSYYPHNVSYIVAGGSNFDSMASAADVTYIEVGETYSPVYYVYVDASGDVDRISVGADITSITIETA